MASRWKLSEQTLGHSEVILFQPRLNPVPHREGITPHPLNTLPTKATLALFTIGLSSI